MRSKLLPGTFDIPAERLAEMQIPGRPATIFDLPTWPTKRANDGGKCMSSYPYSKNRTAEAAKRRKETLTEIDLDLVDVGHEAFR